jgi:hypothetical protein
LHFGAGSPEDFTGEPSGGVKGEVLYLICSQRV